MTPKSLIEPARHAGVTLLRSQTDERLVDLTRGGNERAFEAIVHRYSRPLLRYCSRLLPPARAEDAVQQAFVSAHRAIHAGDAELNLRPWLYRIAHNAALNLLRQNGFDHDQVSEEIDGVETPPQAFERGERLRTVVAAVRDLPERQRSAIVLQAVEGRSYDEIASELGVTDGAVRQLLNRARNTLREAAAAITPTGLITRVAAGGGSESGVAERVAQVLASAGGGALVAKAGATLIVAGAVAGGAATGALQDVRGDHPRAPDRSAAAVLAPTPQATAAPRDLREAVALTVDTSAPAGGVRSVRAHGGSGGDASGGGGGVRGDGSREDGSGSHGSDDGGHHSGGSDDRSGSDDHSGSGGGDSSGSGSSGSSGSGSSGSDSGSDDGGSAGSGGGDSSGSGSSGGSDDELLLPATDVDSHSGSGSSGSGGGGSGSGSGSDDDGLSSHSGSGG
jgi:RNA polymerase sigma factor (sigma-70 family)